MFIDFIEGGRERERERQQHQLVASHRCPNLGLNPQSFGARDDAPTN